MAKSAAAAAAAEVATAAAAAMAKSAAAAAAATTMAKSAAAAAAAVATAAAAGAAGAVALKLQACRRMSFSSHGHECTVLWHVRRCGGYLRAVGGPHQEDPPVSAVGVTPLHLHQHLCLQSPAHLQAMCLTFQLCPPRPLIGLFIQSFINLAAFVCLFVCSFWLFVCLLVAQLFCCSGIHQPAKWHD